MKLFFLFSIYALLFCGVLSAQNSFTEGEKLFLQDKPQEALGFLESAVKVKDAPVQAFLYLSMAYQQVNRLDDAIAVYKKILPTAGEHTALIAYSLGNVYYTKQNFPLAEASYTQAIEADPTYASAYLNRANTRLKTGAVENAVADYTYYLSLDAESAQKPQIEELIAAIQKADQEKADAEAKAAQAKADAEEAETRRKAEEEAEALAKAQADEQKARETIPAIVAAIQTIEGIIAQINFPPSPPENEENANQQDEIVNQEKE